MLTFTYPTSIELRAVEQELLPVLTLSDPIFQHFPMTTVESDLLMWESYDNITGLQAVRGLGGTPSHVRQTGRHSYVFEPGVYGEFETIDEKYLTQGRPLGQISGSINIDQEVRLRQDKLLNRRINRIRQIIWTLLSTGTFSIPTTSGSVLHTDTYSFQTATRAVAWATVATATPIADLRAVQLLARGSSIDFGAGATAYMNRATFNDMMGNTLVTDLGGRITRTIMPGGMEPAATWLADLSLVNKILMGADLPQVAILDDGYISDAGVFTLFVPNNRVVIVGRRANNTVLGEYRMTRNLTNPNGEAGPYTIVVDSAQHGKPVPRTIEVHDGHNGGPVIYHPNGVVVLTV